jgi:hypothetical protein
MTATEYLQREAQAPCTARALVAQGILWAEASCRIDGTMAMALRRGSENSARLLLDEMVRDGIGTMADCPRWLSMNRDAVLEVMASTADSGAFWRVSL